MLQKLPFETTARASAALVLATANYGEILDDSPAGSAPAGCLLTFDLSLDGNLVPKARRGALAALGEVQCRPSAICNRASAWTDRRILKPTHPQAQPDLCVEAADAQPVHDM